MQKKLKFDEKLYITMVLVGMGLLITLGIVQMLCDTCLGIIPY